MSLRYSFASEQLEPGAQLSLVANLTSTPQLPLKTPQIPSNRDQKALNRGPLGGLVSCVSFVGFSDISCCCLSQRVELGCHFGIRSHTPYQMVVGP